MTRETRTTTEIEGIDVVIPVFGAAADLARCVSSVVEHTDLPPHRLTFVVDGPQGSDVEAAMSKVAEPDPAGVRVLRNDKRRGFVASVNRGMEGSSRDVVLLNSDTVVTSGWLERLRAAAYSAPRIATVTPLSNSATICSLPEFLEDNLIPEGVSIDEIGEITTAVSRREYPRLPTGVGVCLYIRRAAIDAVGLFDESRFGLGYGEENEFCIRATRAGFEHVADDATFVYHAGQRSFGSEKKRLEKSAMRKLRFIDRSYRPRIASFIRRDPMLPIRQRIIDRILEQESSVTEREPGGRLSILHVVHGWPPFDIGGTEHYARRLALHQARSHRVSAFVRIADADRATGQRLAYLDRGIRVRLVVNNFDQRNPMARNAMKSRSFERELERFIDLTQPDLVHVHHLSGLGASLVSVIRHLSIPLIYQIQDWWALCARSNLWHADDALCPGPDPARCSACLPLTGLAPRGILNHLLYRARTFFIKRQLRMADAYIMGSRAVHSWYSEKGFLNPAAPAHILDYGATSPPDPASGATSGNGRLTFGFVGALMPHKGAHIAAAAFRGVDPGSARLVIWGNSDLRPDYTAKVVASADGGPVEIRGSFDERRKAEVFSTMDVLVVPSVGLESFGIAAREAMAAGVPVIAARRGALAELTIDEICGALIAPDDPGVLRGWIDTLVENPEILKTWRRSIPEMTTTEEHVAAIEDIYHQVLGSTR